MRFCSSSLTVVSSSFDGLQLLLGGLQLLVGALQLLVRRLQLLVRRLELLVGALQLLDRALQVFLGDQQLALELLAALVLGRSGPRSKPPARRGDARVEASARGTAPGGTGLRVSGSTMGSTSSSTDARLAVVGQPGLDRRCAALLGLGARGSRGADRRAAPGRARRRRLRLACARRRLEVRPGPPAEVDDVQVLVDHHARRAVELEDLAVGYRRQAAGRPLREVGWMGAPASGACTPNPKSSAALDATVRRA